jgi:signal transduction histidine kinase/CheY-like chemotaxis protein
MFAMRFPKISKWAMIYFVLAGFDLLTITGSLSLSHMGMLEFERSVEENRVWEDRLSELTILSREAQLVNAPGNDVFDSYDVQAARATRDSALVSFEHALDALIADTRSIEEDASRAQLQELLLQTDQAMAAMLTDADSIFSFFESGESEQAGRLMASMDRNYAAVTNTISDTMLVIHGIMGQQLTEQYAKAENLRRFEYIIGAVILLIITAIAIYGHKMGQIMSRAEATLRASRDAAQKANAQKSIFLANMSHEIRTPLNGVIGMATAISQTKLDSDQRNQVTIIRESGELLLTTINDILDISKIEAGQLSIETVPFNLRTVLDRIERLHEPAATEKGIVFSVEVDKNVVEHLDREGDPTRLTQILHNLVSNAVKFTRSGGVTVDVTADSDASIGSNCLRISVTDTGQGLSTSQIDRIFKPFSQADETTTRTHGGTGLGLPIVSQLAELMGGVIDVSSVVSQGSRFTVTLPLPHASSSADGLADTESRVPRASLDSLLTQIPENLRILVADDNLTNRLVMKALLAPINAEVVFAKDGLEAVAACSARRFDVIFLDIRMPICDGEEALRRILKREQQNQLPHVPVIAQTANAMVHEVDRYLAAGFDGCLPKPVQQIALFKEILTAVDEIDTCSDQAIDQPKRA